MDPDFTVDATNNDTSIDENVTESPANVHIGQTVCSTNRALIEQNITNKSHKGSCDNADMIVLTSDEPCKNKKLCCPFCLKLFAKLARHLETVHKNEAEVKKFSDLPKGL